MDSLRQCGQAIQAESSSPGIKGLPMGNQHDGATGIHYLTKSSSPAIGRDEAVDAGFNELPALFAGGELHAPENVTSIGRNTDDDLPPRGNFIFDRARQWFPVGS